MAHGEHYKHFPPKFEPYKICNNAFCNGNLQQIFQYVARRRCKGSEIQDLKKAWDFLQYEKERRAVYVELEAKIVYVELEAKIQRFQAHIYTGVYILDLRLSEDFAGWCEENDMFLGAVYGCLIHGFGLVSLEKLIKKEILKLTNTNL